MKAVLLQLLHFTLILRSGYNTILPALCWNFRKLRDRSLWCPSAQLLSSLAVSRHEDLVCDYGSFLQLSSAPAQVELWISLWPCDPEEHHSNSPHRVPNRSGDHKTSSPSSVPPGPRWACLWPSVRRRHQLGFFVSQCVW